MPRGWGWPRANIVKMATFKKDPCRGFKHDQPEERLKVWSGISRKALRGRVLSHPTYCTAAHDSDIPYLASRHRCVVVSRCSQTLVVLKRYPHAGPKASSLYHSLAHRKEALCVSAYI